MLTLFSAGFTTTPALAPISDRLMPGELLAIVGPNGAGKSTLLTLLSGFRVPEQGSVCLDGMPLTAWEPQALARRRALVAQQVRPSFDWEVRELVALGSDAGAERVDACLAALDLTLLAERRLTGLSGGEAQRCLVARALCQLAADQLVGETDTGADQAPPGLLLLDEPTSALDIGQQQRLMRLLRRLASERGLAIACVLHDLNLAGRFAHRVWLLDKGRRIAAGTPEEVLSAARLASIFEAELDEAPSLAGGPPTLVLAR
ncbi:ATP-binding cassette domain-containing protein [Halomonas sp. 328]|uniref:ATP-binding cassette domain-containing protein n=1 Tax=Halomonas sp. 328 TaxID=2776704 RepID=UPI0018A79C74|nr:ATP-binding cassette domain-containing protein [Halomonas sp. 328]MBF8222162.1 ATP-binding cassette domain-containing protein [Halomonas sp. 328]